MKTAVIDLDSICFSIGSGNKVLDEFGIPIKKDNKFVYVEKTYQELMDCADYWMTTILDKTNSTHYIAYIKGKNTTDFRKNINPCYKANRSLTPPWYWDFVKAYLIHKWKAVSVDNIEVDDAVNITRLHIKEAFICAIDRDLLDLQGIHYHWRDDRWVTTNSASEQYAFWRDMVAGQKGDGLNCLEGYGIKAVEKYFKDQNPCNYPTIVLDLYLDEYGDDGVDEFYKNYKCLKILEKSDKFTIPEPIQYIPINNNQDLTIF